MPRDRIESPVLHKLHTSTFVIPGQHLGEIEGEKRKTKVIIALRMIDSLTNYDQRRMRFCQKKNIKEE